MPVTKFRTFEEAKEALWDDASAPDYLERVAWLWAFSDRLSRPRPRPGVRRFRSLSDKGEDLSEI